MTLDDDDVGALLALVDEAYTSQRAARAQELRRITAAQCRDLRAHIAVLELQLDDARRCATTDEAINETRLWAPLALAQRQQRKAVERENAELRRVAWRHHALSRRITTLLGELHSMLQQAMPRTQVLAQSGPCSPIPALFVRRLDAVCHQIASRELEVTSCFSREHETKWKEGQLGLRYRFRSRAQYPFQLSSVVDEFWRGLHEQMPTIFPAQDEVYYADTRFQLCKPFGWVEVRGPSAMRRVYTSDGGVLLLSASIVAGTKSEENDNLMAGLEMHETVTIRLVRTDASNPRSPVFVERVTETDVLPTSGTEGIRHNRHNRRALQRFREYIERYAAEDRGEGRQEVENRLLDASLSRGRAASLMYERSSMVTASV